MSGKKEAEIVNQTIVNKLILMLLLVLLIILTVGCSNADVTEKTLVYRGESENWEGLVINECQESWSKDENNRLRYNNAAREKLYLKYKIADYINLGHISWKLKSSAGGGGLDSGEEVNPTPDRFGYIYCGGGGGRGVVLTREGDFYTLTIEWDGGNKETFELINVRK